MERTEAGRRSFKADRGAPELSSNGREIIFTAYSLRETVRLSDLIRIIGTHLDDDSVYSFALGYQALDRGHFASARAHFGKLLVEGGAGDRYLLNSALSFIRLQWAVLARLDAKEPNGEEVDRG